MNTVKLIIWLLFFIFATTKVSAQILTGTVSSSAGHKLIGQATIKLLQARKSVLTDEEGRFKISINVLPDTILISYIGYQSQQIPIGKGNTLSLTIVLQEQASLLNEVVVNTGYYQVARERATGSFTQIDQQLINRSVSPNILERLEGVANGLQFDRRNISGENAQNKKPELRIRGLSTLSANSAPLLIVDNFPYEGDITSINPNDVESVTILKDAAASSIWGARAGNGVIVINTKKGKYRQQANINVNSSLNFIEKPDLYYSRNYLPSATVMNIQEDLFNREGYTENNLNYLPSYVELLIKKRDNLIGDSEFDKQKAQMQQTDFREQALDNLYRRGLQQQYALNANGGTESYNYYFSANLDHSKQNIIGNGSKRINLNSQNSFKINGKMEINAGIWYSFQDGQNNGITYSSIGNGVREPYSALTDQAGNSVATGIFGRRLSYQEQAQSNRLIDWMYRPLNEISLNDNTFSSTETRINTGIKYNLLRAVVFNANYQFIRGSNESQNYHDQNSYYVRNLVNTYTQTDGQQIIPNGGILEGKPNAKYEGHSGRLQLSYNQNFSQAHQVTALAGGEINQQVAETYPGFTLYNYSRENLGGTVLFDYTKFYPIRPIGSARIPGSAGGTLKSNNRNLSYFSNAAYTYRDRYIVSASGRWDGSNLLGVKTNQRGTVLWSAGVSWELSKESFYKISMLSYLRLRATYGKAGLIDKTQSQYPSISLLTDGQTNLPYASLQHPGNPSLQWERVNTTNVAIDWVTEGQRLSGSFEWFEKNSRNLLGNILIDPTTGAGLTFKQNYGTMRTKGFDLQVNSQNLTGSLKWESAVLLSYAGNKVRSFNTPVVPFITPYLNSIGKPPVAGRSADVIYALPWNGLDHNTGLPLIYIDGNPSTNYLAYTNGFKPENLETVGLEVPPYFGSLRNTFSWKGLQLAAVISFKWGYVFRRSSIEPGAEFQTSSPKYHVDYNLRWKQPGDEINTNIPAATLAYDSSMGYAYSQSEILITDGNHIRLQDLSLTYNVKVSNQFPLKQLKVFAYGRNLGILWRKNKFGIDPDYPYAEFTAPRTIAFGIQTSL